MGMIQRKQLFQKKFAGTYSVTLSTSVGMPGYGSKGYRDIVEGTRKAMSRDTFINDNRRRPAETISDTEEEKLNATAIDCELTSSIYCWAWI